MGTPLLTPQKGTEPPSQIFGPCLLWPNRWMDQDGTWHGGRPQPCDFALDGDPAPPQKGGGAPSPIIGPFLLWPNGWMHQHATGYGGRPQPKDFVLDGDPAPPQKRGRSHKIFGPFVLWPKGWMVQDGIWHGGRPQPRQLHVRWGRSTLPQKGTDPNFRPMSIAVKRLHRSRCHLVRR